jgi:hypothetical protein
MSQPKPSGPEQPEPSGAEQPEPGAECELADAEPVSEPEPLNRAARRAKAKQTDPSHVGPRGGLTRQVRGARSHTKRRTS